jgi:hypothetical protein
MTIPVSQYVDLLVKKLIGVAKTDTETNKSPSNESIPSPALNRGDTLWTQAIDIPPTATATPNLIQANTNGNAIQCTADTTCVPIGGIYPTWLTNITEWIPLEFGSTYTVQAYVGPPGAANIVATGTFISNAGQAGIGEWFFDYQAGLLNFIGETIPPSLTSGNVVYIVGYNYIGLTGVTTLPGNTTIGNISIIDTTLTSTDINGNLITFSGNSGVVLPSGNSTQRPGNAVLGTTRFNTTIDSIEAWDGVQWVTSGNIISPGTIVDQQILPDGTSDTYTLVQASTTDAVLVSINGVNQLPNVAYTVANTSITFTQTPLTQDLIDIRFISYVTTISYLTNGLGNASVVVTPEGNILFTTSGNLLSTMSSNSMTVAGGISASGNITTSGYFVGNLSGNISGNILAPGANTQVIYNTSGNFAASAGFTFNASSNVLSVSGNILSGSVISAAGLVTGGNINGTNITGNLVSGNQSNITNVGTLSSLNVNGNLTGSNISATFISVDTINSANIGNTGTKYIGTNLSVTGNVIANSLTGTLITATQTNITSVGNLSSLRVTGDVSLSGNIVVPNTLSIVGNVSAIGNVTASRFSGNGSTLSSITGSNVVGAVGTATFATTSGSATTAATITINAQPNITSVGTLSTLSVAGNAVAGNYSTAGIISAAGNITTAGYFIGNFQGNISGNIVVPGSNTQVLFNDSGNAGASAGLTFDSASNILSAAGNVTASRFIGNGSTLSSITASNIVGTVANATFATSAGTVATVTTNAQPNITSVGTLSNVFTSGQVSAAGNITTSGFFLGTFAGNISGNLTVPGSNTQVIYNDNGNAGASAGFTFNAASNAIVVTGNITGGNIRTVGQVSAGGNITGANLSVNADAVITGNLTVNGTTTTVNSNTVTINDKFINVANNASTSTLANGGGLGVGPVGTEYATLTFNNNTTSWNTNIPLSVTGNITGNYHIGNGSTLSSITGANVTGTVANATYAASAGSTSSAGTATTAVTVTGNAQANITSVGILTSLSVSGNITGGNLSVGTGTITVGNIVNGNGNVVGNIGSASNYFNTVFAQATSALYADLAENYLADAEYAPGTVLSFGGSAELTISTQDQDPTVAGVVSTNPAYHMNSGLEGEFVTPLTLSGRVPCLVQGPVTAGSMMVSAGNGRARAEKNPAMGTVIGKAINSFDGDVGIIEIVVGRV